MSLTKTVNGHTLTVAEQHVVETIQDYLQKHGGDSCTVPNCSPVGDGRWVRLTEIFPRSAQGTASRRIVNKLHPLGVLRPYEIAFYGDCVKAVQYEKIEEVEAATAAQHRNYT